MTDKLINEEGFEQSKVDKCLFYRGKVIYAIYHDDSIVAGPDEQKIEDVIKQKRENKLDIAEEVTLEDFIGVNIERMDDGTIHLPQPHLINQILTVFKLDDEEVNAETTPYAYVLYLDKYESTHINTKL